MYKQNIASKNFIQKLEVISDKKYSQHLCLNNKLIRSLVEMILFLALLSVVAAQEVLLPPYFDIAKGKSITATATCGEDYTPPVGTQGELFCTLADATGEFGIKGLECNHCVPGEYGEGDGRNMTRDHNIKNANDGSNRWWQSPPLSRGLQYRKINITIDLGQTFHVAYVILKSANSPRPGVWVLERSNDNGQTYSPWYYFAPTSRECRQYFGVDSYLPIVRDDTVICSTEYSKIPPFKNGEIHISLINGRPGAKNFSTSTTLQEWTSATNVRFRLLDIKTLLTDLLPLSLEDPTVTRRKYPVGIYLLKVNIRNTRTRCEICSKLTIKTPEQRYFTPCSSVSIVNFEYVIADWYYYSIKDITIGGRCMCNGFADECLQSTKEAGKYECDCQYNAEGPQCGRCKEGYEQKKWKQRTEYNKFECEQCNCHGHADECEYNEEIDKRKLSLDIGGNYEGGGVCQNCKHNTLGINCEKCKPFFYRPANVPIDSPDVCQPCNCNTQLSTGLCAEETGQCECKPNYVGRYCDRCNKGYHMFPDCKPCECDVNGSEDGECIADIEVGCKCKRGYTGRYCDECSPGFFNFPDCQPCECLTRFGAVNNNCRREDGQCPCKSSFAGRQCDQCAAGYYEFPYCRECGCDTAKTLDSICEAGTGVCECKANYAGPKCERCAPGHYAHPNCYGCGCSTSGSLSAICDENSGRCTCRPNYTGFQCNRCKEGYYGFPNCLPCDCNSEGSLEGRLNTCDTVDGQCFCKPTYSGLKCDRCLPGFYGFPDCKQCNCNPAGTKPGPGGQPGDCSTNNNGQCVCKENVQGLECNECKPGFFDLRESNQRGCSECGCNRAGTNNGVNSCSTLGECKCKAFVKEGGKCTVCEDGHYGLKDENIFGCSGCDCNAGGSKSNVCSKESGKCPCQENIVGQKCDSIAPKHFFHGLCHIKAELEEGVTTDGDAISFGYQEEQFPGYSWKGFVAISDKQPAVIVTIDVPRNSNYEVLFKYALNQIQAETGKVTLSNGDQKFVGAIIFASTQKGDGFETALGKVEEVKDRPLYFRLKQGEWKIRLEVPDSKLVVDYVVLVPQEYMQATALTKTVQNACKVKSDEKFCNLYQYVDLSNNDKIIKLEAEKPGRSLQRYPAQLFNDTEVLSKLDYEAMVILSPENRQLNILFKRPTPGKYVIMIQYYHDSDVTKSVDVYIRSRTASQRGRALLYSCRYTFGCRQAVLEKNSNGVYLYNVKEAADHLVTLVAKSGATVAIDSIIFIPYESWHLDYSTPKLYCVTKDSKCTKMVYDIPRGSRVILAQQKDSDPRPSYLIDPTVKVQYMKTGINVINIKDVQVGSYLVMAHYYQPNSPTFESRAGVYSGRGSGLPGRINFEYCPNLNGCRSPVKRSQSGGDAYVFEEGDARIRFDLLEEQEVWIEYLLLVPEGTSVTNLYTPKPLNYGKDFLEQCVDQKDLCSTENTSKFCKDGIFIITTDFNKGGTPCNCNSEGSTSDSCKEFGGQCPCKDNVIGRTCSRCKVGFYGFPNCKPCNCSNCDDVTGKCTCPPHVIGDKCDQCAPGTFGFDPIIGCQKCSCDDIGTIVSNASCNVTNGQCPCKENFSGRKCSVCRAGYFNYPLCRKCDCLNAGVTGDKCNAITGTCFCQENVVGSQCTECPAGYFKTKDENGKQLCTKCWCQGRSTSCTEAELFKAPVISAATGWVLSMDSFTVRENGAGLFEADISSLVNDGSNNPTTLYWKAPDQFLGDQGSSYGGQLTYHFQYSVVDPAFDGTIENVPDVILKGNGFTLKAISPTIRLPDFENMAEVPILETDWALLDGTPADRELLLGVLSKVVALHIRATHDVNALTTLLSNVTLDSALRSGSEIVFGIEQCFCPPEYDGPSCTKCAEGFTRQEDGSCSKCECLGKSNVCDTETGDCIDCSDNTMGVRCEKCKPGFYGDKCKPCECPYVNPKNNFADTCNINISTSLLECQCKPGYEGVRCDQCADGYYGNPLEIGGSCKRCMCNGNIDLSLTGNCDKVTGECYKCLNNTAGKECEQCRDGFYGDAVEAKNCKDCRCSICGSAVETCNRVTGRCKCKENVEGEKCDRCQPNTWNFDACNGCEDCDCAPASESQQCDLTTGQCKCSPTVFGKKCDWCKLGYFNYSSAGCQKCNCPDGDFCDVITGRCCKGFLGEDCTVCPPGHIIENGECVECDRCVQNTLNRVNVLIYNVTQIENQLIPSGILNYASLEEVNKTLLRLTDEASKQLDNLEALRKAIGFGKYGNYNGSMNMYLVKDFESCRFENDTEPTITMLPTTTVTLSTVPSTTEPTTTTTTTESVTTTEAVTATVSSATTTNFQVITEMSTTTEAVALTTTDFPVLTTTDFAFTTTEEPPGPEPIIVDPSETTTEAPRGNSIAKKRKRRAAVPRCPMSLAKLIEVSGTYLEETDNEISLLEKDAYESSANASYTRKRAEDLLAQLRAFMLELKEILAIANNTMTGVVTGNIDGNSSLLEAEAILKELQERNFSEVITASEKEKRSSINATIIAKSLMDQAKEVEEKISKFNNTFKNLLEAFKNLKRESEMVQANAVNATSLIDMAKAIDYESLIDMAKEIHAKNNVTVNQAMEILQFAKSAYDAAKKAYDQFNNERGPLNRLMEELREYIKKLEADLNITKPVVDGSVEHAKKLREDANKLKDLLQDTRKYADAALRAARVYQNIVDAIKEALEAAKMANETAHDAEGKAQKAKQDAVQSSIRSQSVDKEATDLTEDVKKKLQVDISDIKMRLKDLRDLREKIQGRIGVVKTDIKAFEKEKEVGEKAMNISSEANKVNEISEEGQNVSNSVNNNVTKDGEIVNQLKDDISEINKSIKEVAQQVTRVEDNIPRIKSELEEVNRKHDEIDIFIKNNITNSIEYVKYLIDNARDLTNTMPLAMKFNASSEVELEAPKSAYDPSINNKIELTFKVNEPNGFLFFIGDSQNNNSGYMSLEVKDSRVVFNYKLHFTGPVHSLINSKEIKNGETYQITAIRNFASAILNVKNIGNDTTLVSAYRDTSNGPSVLLLGENTDVLVGFFPSSNNRKTFDGCMNQLRFDDELMGLWYWKRAQNVGGCVQKFKPFHEGNYTFDGNGFVEFDLSGEGTSGFRRTELSFATLEENGLIFLGTNPPQNIGGITVSNPITTFSALEMKDGYLVSKFDFGNGFKTYVHTAAGKLNDGKTHTFLMRVKSKKFLKFLVDGKVINNIDITKDTTDLRYAVSEVFIGGVPMQYEMPHPDITTKGFTGAIGKAKVRGVDLAGIKSFNNARSEFILPIARSASFPEKSSYIEIAPCNLTESASFGFSFQSQQENGLLFYSGKEGSSLEIRIKDGQVNVEVTGEGDSKTVQTNIQGGVSDGMWHTIALYLQELAEGNNMMTLSLGTDLDFVEADIPKISISGEMFLGGKPGSSDGFNGNIRQIYCDQVETNLAAGKAAEGALVGSLRLIPPLELSEVTIIPTTLPPKTTTTVTTTTTTTTTIPSTTTTTVVTTTTASTTMTTVPVTTTTSNQPITTTTDSTTASTTKVTTTITEESTTTALPTTLTTEPETTATLTTGSELTMSTTTTEEPTTTTAEPTTTITESTSTSTTTPITTPTSTEKPLAECKNLLVPFPDSYGFGSQEESCLQFEVKKGSLSTKSQFEFSFYTLENNGMLLIGNPGTSFDYEAVYMENGVLKYIFNAGSGYVRVQSDRKYNDGAWHEVQTQRDKSEGLLTIDGELIGKDSKTGLTSVNDINVLYVGGFPKDAKQIGVVPAKSRVGFKGGIKGLKSFNKALVASKEVGISPAYNGLQIQEAVSLGTSGGYAFDPKMTKMIGFNFMLDMDVRAKTNDGYLFFATEKKDFLSLYLKEGKVIVECDNGGGRFSVTVDPPSSICNGEFHSISLKKEAKKLTLRVDGATKTFTTTKGSTAANTRTPYYYGGMPKNYQPRNYVPFAGCITAVKVNDKPISLVTDDFRYSGSIMRGCASNE